MRITSLFRLYGAIFLIAILLLSGLTLWNIQRSHFWDERIELAQHSYHTHLLLESHIYQLMKQHADALLIGDRDKGTGEAAIQKAITEDVAEIRSAIAREIEMVGEEEYEELETRAEIESRVRALTASLSRMSATNTPFDPDIRREQLADILDRKIDEELATLINESLEEEQKEVMDTSAEAQRFRRNSRIAVILAMFAAAASLAGFAFTYVRLVGDPLDGLMNGLQKLHAGNYNDPMPRDGAIEFQRLAEVLDDMASGLKAREAERKTEQERLESKVHERTQELQKLVAQIERTESNRRQLMADISHELRTPLTIVQGEAEVTLRGNVTEAQDYADVLARIRDSARHMNRIVDDMLLIARQEAGKLRLEMRETDLRLVLTEASDMFPMDVLIKAPDQALLARIDRIRLRQCILAVFQNARRYGGPNITAQIESTDDAFEIAIEDNGPGMTDAEKAQAFERYFRGSNASQGDEAGSGLGLPIVRAIMAAHGGKVTLSDRDGGGLRVSLQLPSKPRLDIVRWDDDDIQPGAYTSSL